MTNSGGDCNDPLEYVRKEIEELFGEDPNHFEIPSTIELFEIFGGTLAMLSRQLQQVYGPPPITPPHIQKSRKQAKERFDQQYGDFTEDRGLWKKPIPEMPSPISPRMIEKQQGHDTRIAPVLTSPDENDPAFDYEHFRLTYEAPSNQDDVENVCENDDAALLKSFSDEDDYEEDMQSLSEEDDIVVESDPIVEISGPNHQVESDYLEIALENTPENSPDAKLLQQELETRKSLSPVAGSSGGPMDGKGDLFSLFRTLGGDL